MLVQPQSETEAIMEAALWQRGIVVERGMSLENLSQHNNEVQLVFKDANGESSKINVNGIVIGADGHKSKVRESVGVPFKGWEHHEVFKMYDVELETSISPIDGHYRFYKEGGMLMLHIRDGVWRIGGNVKDAFEHLPKGTRSGKISWETTFTIQEKVAEKFSVDNVYILGDAGHVHSPAGAKGMNLCIEDSYIFSQLLKEGREADYHKTRYSKIKRTVGIVGQLTDKIGGHNFFGRTVRNNLDTLSVFFPLIMPPLRRFLMGLN
jgi:2-polyprenyl-6-methoxyphenol hydroxylase-like FAD-dependent oxidoreductase